MTKGQETRLANLLRKKEYEVLLNGRDSRDFQRLSRLKELGTNVKRPPLRKSA